MPLYLVQLSYTSEGWAALARDPQDRIDNGARPAVEQLGGKVVGGWVSFGEYDIVSVIDLPSNLDAAAFSIAVSAGGAVKSFKTTPLMAMDEAVQAMKKAGASTYAPAGA
jgi:uncharacterized protein with GYD domain